MSRTAAAAWRASTAALRLVEGLALPDEETESRLSYYNTRHLLDRHRPAAGGLRPARGKTCATRKSWTAAVRGVAARMPTYITLKDVKKRWGKGQEDVFPVAQFEKLWGDMTALPELDCRFVAVPAPARPAIERAGATRRLAARRLGRVSGVPLRLVRLLVFRST